MRKRLIMMTVATGALVIAMAVPAAAHEVDDTALPIGDGPVSTPTNGGVYRCGSGGGQGGSSATGDWINGDGTWDSTKKPTVDGDVEWPAAEVTITSQGSTRVISGNGLPIDHTTGEFPISSSDDAYQYDRNPNSISESTVSVELPKNPEVADEATCLSAGPIGYLKTGVALFDALDAGGRDAVVYEIQDKCNGHPQQSGQYHYHNVSTCVLDALDSDRGQSKLLGYALDGFGIYGPRDASGKELTNDDLDECHGTTSVVKFNGKKQRIYHYVITKEYPYTLGCFKGTPSSSGQDTGPNRDNQQATGNGGTQTGMPPTGAPPNGMPPGPPPAMAN
jgi:hypothetical protein